MTTSRRRSTRDRPAKAPLSEQAVVDAALETLAAEGLPAVTMRRVATALDTGPASLYAWVDGRDGLVRAVQDRVFATVTLEPPDPARWRAQLHGLLGRTRRALLDHPGLAAAVTATPPSGEASLLLQENLLGLLAAGGLRAQEAAWTADILAALVNYAAIEGAARPADPQRRADELFRRFSDLSADRFPHTTASAAQLVAGDTEERFAVAVDVVVDGMLARTARF